MGSSLATIDSAEPATAFSTLVSNPNTQAVLDRAFDHSATFTAGEIATAEQVAAGVPAIVLADEDYIRRSLGSLAGAMPAQATSNDGGRVKLKTYQAMLAGCDERALRYACRRCLNELDWMPTVHQLKERMADWVSPEAAAIARAKAIVRSGRRAPAADDAEIVTLADMRQLRERAQSAAASLARPRPQPVAFAEPGDLQPHQLRIPNKGDYEKLFGLDVEAVRARAEAEREEAEERDADLLRAAMDTHIQLHRAA